MNKSLHYILNLKESLSYFEARKRKQLRRERGGLTCHLTAAHWSVFSHLGVCVEQVWEGEFVNACYQRGGGSGAAINTAIRGRAGLRTPIGSRQNASSLALIPNLYPSLCFPSPIITAERLSAARHRAVRKRNAQDTQPLLSHGLLISHTHSQSVPTWGFCVCMLLLESVNTSSAQSPSL